MVTVKRKGAHRIEQCSYWMMGRVWTGLDCTGSWLLLLLLILKGSQRQASCHKPYSHILPCYAFDECQMITSMISKSPIHYSQASNQNPPPPVEGRFYPISISKALPSEDSFSEKTCLHCFSAHLATKSSTSTQFPPLTLILPTTTLLNFPILKIPASFQKRLILHSIRFKALESLILAVSQVSDSVVTVTTRSSSKHYKIDDEREA